MEPCNTLNKLNIEYKEIEHQAVYTSIEAEFIKDLIDGEGVKNLFLKSSKKKYYLVLTPDTKKVDLKFLSTIVGSNLSFANEERLKEILKLEKGSVTPLGIINDTNHEVTVLIDKELKDKLILVHPLINTKTISIKMPDLIKLIEDFQNEYLFY